MESLLVQKVETEVIKEVPGIRKSMKDKAKVLILRGKAGRKVFDEIKNGPKVPYEKLKLETEAFKAELKKNRENKL